ncbi:MAG: TSUP family transporter [Opitutales bacterium]
MPEPGLTSFALLAVGVLFAAFTQGFSGFGLGILVMATLTWYVPDAERLSVIATLTGLITMVTLMTAERGRARIDWRGVAWLFGGVLLGMPLGYFLVLKTGDQPIFPLTLGGVLLLFAINGLCRPRLRRLPEWAGVPMGVLSGFISGGFASGGPPLVLYLYAREADPRMAKRSLQVIFILAVFIRLSWVEGAGPGLTQEILAWSAGLGVCALLGSLTGNRLSRRVRPRRFTQAVYVLIGLGGLLNIAHVAIALR